MLGANRVHLVDDRLLVELSALAHPFALVVGLPAQTDQSAQRFDRAALHFCAFRPGRCDSCVSCFFLNSSTSISRRSQAI